MIRTLEGSGLCMKACDISNDRSLHFLVDERASTRLSTSEDGVGDENPNDLARLWPLFWPVLELHSCKQ